MSDGGRASHREALSRIGAAVTLVLALGGCRAPAVLPDVPAASRAATGVAAEPSLRITGGPVDEPGAPPSALTLEGATRAALFSDPEVQASLARLRISLADANQARLLPDPLLSVVLRFPAGGGCAHRRGGAHGRSALAAHTAPPDRRGRQLPAGRGCGFAHGGARRRRRRAGALRGGAGAGASWRRSGIGWRCWSSRWSWRGRSSRRGSRPPWPSTRWRPRRSSWKPNSRPSISSGGRSGWGWPEPSAGHPTRRCGPW